ncbi:hypothetical protein [Streptomyces bambusae]|uniref:Collagen-like protein n=1 Tax=Streptomyces bambusae TaxID=1550616 RepID=A0ABS6Z5U9_9ACTN|nr:hypothetical protein [Streptomyces bambusae]MBW5483107.1 hypothetical protein [Streptomyces bambusae]
MAVSKNWEEALKVFMSDTGSLADRNAVAGAGSAGWVVRNSLRIVQNASSNQDWSKTFDFHWSGYATLTTDSGENVVPPVFYVVGFNLDWKNVFDNMSSKWNLWFHDPEKALTPLVASPYKNDVINPVTFDRAANQVKGIIDWFDHWVPAVKGWADSIESDASEWKGSAAGAFRKFLNVINVEMSKVRLDLTAPYDYITLLTTTKEQLQKSTLGMYNGFDTWRQLPRSNAVNLLREVFNEVMTGAQIQVGWQPYAVGDTYGYDAVLQKIVDRGGSDVTNAHWIDGVEGEAKQRWLGNLTSLDEAAKTHVSLLDDAYLKLAGALKEGVYQPSITMPGGGTGPGPNGPTTNPLNDLLNKNPGDKNPLDGKGGPGGTGGSKDMPNLKPGGGSGGTGDKPPGGIPGNPGPGKTGPGGLPGGLNPGTSPGTGGAGGNVPLLDKNGKPVLGPDGKPVMVPPGSRIGKDGKVYDAKGNPVLGPNGKPVVAPPGGKVGTQPTDNQPPGGLIPGTNPYDRIMLPEGAKILENGTVVDAGGKPLLDANGNPYALPKGATVKDGIVVDADGKPLSRTNQLLTNAEHAIASRPPRLTTQSGGLPFDFASGGSRLPGLDGLSSGSGGLGGDGPKLKGNAATVGAMTGISERAAQNLGSLANSPAATAANAAGQQQRADLAAQQHAQPPMMPPMSPGMGAGGQPGQGKDRRRTTWLTEDEEVWGTDTGSVSGVIGR